MLYGGEEKDRVVKMDLGSSKPFSLSRLGRRRGDKGRRKGEKEGGEGGKVFMPGSRGLYPFGEGLLPAAQSLFLFHKRRRRGERKGKESYSLKTSSLSSKDLLKIFSRAYGARTIALQSASLATLRYAARQPA